tara:strand:+ start:14848 stop:17583 length:2736 start_codon:yes stop_codon:yes gene_type:complete
MANVRKSKGYVDTVDFGSVTFGYEFSGTIPFNNSSNIPLKLTALIEGSDASFFSIEGDQVFQVFIPARSTYNLPISFLPNAARSFSSTVKCSFNNSTVKINGSDFHSIELKGQGNTSLPTKPSFTLKLDEYPFDSRNIITNITLRQDVDRYEIYYSLTPASTLIKAEEYNGISSEFIFLGLDFDTEYHILVRAFNIHGSTDSDRIMIKTKIHTLNLEIGGIVPNLNVYDKVLGQGSDIYYYNDVALTILQSSIIYCDKCNTADERAFNKGLPYRYETTYTPSMPDMPSFSQAKPALSTGPKIMDQTRQLPLKIDIYGQVLGSGGTGGNGGGQNVINSTYISPPNLVRTEGLSSSFDSTGQKPGITGPQFLEGGDAISIEYDCELNIHATGKVKGGGGGGYGGGPSFHTGYGGAYDEETPGYGDDAMAFNVAASRISNPINGQYTPTHYHGRRGDSSNTEMLNWINNGKLSSKSIDSAWHLIDHGAQRVADDDDQTTKDHIDFFNQTATSWSDVWKGGTALNSTNPDGSTPSRSNIFLGGGGGGGGQGFSAGDGGKAGSCSLSRERSHQTGNQGGNVAYGHTGQVLQGSMPFQRGDNATRDVPGGPSQHYKSALYRIQSEGMSADALRARGPYPSEDGERQRFGQGLWSFYVYVHVKKRRWRRRVRTRSHFRTGRAIMDIRGGAGGSYGLYGEERPADSFFCAGGTSDMNKISADNTYRDTRNLGKDNFFRGYVKTDIAVDNVMASNPFKSRADIWNIFNFKYLGSDKIAIYAFGSQLSIDVSKTFEHSFSTSFSTAIFMDKNAASPGYWNQPSIIKKPTSKLTNPCSLQFASETFSSYSINDTGIIGTIKPHGFPGKAIVLNGNNVSGSGWTIGCHNDDRIAGLVVPGRVPRLNKRTVSGEVYNREYRSFF